MEALASPSDENIKIIDFPNPNKQVTIVSLYLPENPSILPPLSSYYNRNLLLKRKTNSSSIINNESISSNTITQFDEKWLDLISIPDKKSVYDYINVNQEIIDVLEKIVNKAKFFDISPSDLILWKRKDREDDSFEYLLLIITFHENFMKKHLDIINELTNIIANKMNQMSSTLVISAKYST